MCADLAGEVARLRAALEEIANPIAAMRRRAESEGRHLSGLAYQIANDPNYLKQVARAALSTANGEAAE